jgi:hypothetical protein
VSCEHLTSDLEHLSFEDFTTEIDVCIALHCSNCATSPAPAALLHPVALFLEIASLELEQPHTEAKEVVQRSAVALAQETVDHGVVIIQRLDELARMVTEGLGYTSQYVKCLDTYIIDASISESFWN